jgi:hypothetical protein
LIEYASGVVPCEDNHLRTVVTHRSDLEAVLLDLAVARQD